MRPEDKRRLSIVNLLKGSKRPAVYMLQEALEKVGVHAGGIDGNFGPGCDKGVRAFQSAAGLREDGEVGKGTWSVLLRQAYQKGFKPGLPRRCQELISWFEVDGYQNTYGQAEPDIGDGAGANYGLLQHNRHGSLVHVLKLGGRSDLALLYKGTKDKSQVIPEIKEWMGSRSGRDAQNAYFMKVVWRLAARQLKTLPEIAGWENNPFLHRYYERAMMMMCDTVTQNGTFWSSKRKPFWKSLTAEEAQVAKYRELYEGEGWDELLGQWVPYTELKVVWFRHEKDQEGNRAKANVAACNELLSRVPDAEKKLVMLAQWRARTSWEKYWRAVAARRMLDATGHGRVNGATISLSRDYGIGVDSADVEDRDGGSMESFVKDAGADILQDLDLDGTRAA